MSTRAPVHRLRQLAFVAGVVFAALPGLDAPAIAAAGDNTAPVSDAASGRGVDRPRPSVRPPFQGLIARVFVNTVNKGDLPLLLDAVGQVLVPATEFSKWNLSLAG